MFVILETGGKQYKVSEGQMLKVEKLSGEIGDKITLNTILLLSENDGSKVEIGKPFIMGKIVEAEIVKQGRAKKVTVIKYKPKVRYRRKVGHRQPFTELKILNIQ